MLTASLVVEVLVAFGLPVGLWVLLRPRWGLIGAGVVSFLGSQVVHAPLLWGLGLLEGGRGAALGPLPLQALAVGLSAGVCEEGARYLVLRLWKREARSWIEGVALGAGHGGIEAILVGLAVAANLVFMLTLDAGDLEAMGLSGQALAEAQAQVEAFWSTPWYVPLLAGLERAFALAIHVALTLLVVESVRRRNLAWLGAAVVAHTLVDGQAALLAAAGASLVALEGAVALFGVGALGLILALRRPADPGEER